MKFLMESILIFSEETRARICMLAQVMLGSLFLSVLSQIRIPFYPVPMTFQTLGVFVLGIGLGGRRSFYSASVYLGLASLGLPVLSGGISHPLWFNLPVGGYLLGFPIAAYVIGKILSLKKRPSFFQIVGSILMGQCIIYVLGIVGLTRFLSIEHSLLVGLFPFLPFAGVKLLMASVIGKFWIRFNRK